MNHTLSDTDQEVKTQLQKAEAELKKAQTIEKMICNVKSACDFFVAINGLEELSDLDRNTKILAVDKIRYVLFDCEPEED